MEVDLEVDLEVGLEVDLEGKMWGFFWKNWLNPFKEVSNVIRMRKMAHLKEKCLIELTV